MPFYYSGTYCYATGSARIESDGGGGPSSFTRSELYVNGVLVASREFPGLGPPILAQDRLAVVFDSTHFADGSSVVVHYQIWDDLGTLHQATGLAPVDNRARLFGRYDLEVSPLTWNHKTSQWSFGNDDWRAIASIAARLFQTNISYDVVTNQGWAKQQLLNGLSDGNIFYIHTHGDNRKVWTDFNDYWYQYPGLPLMPQENAYPLVVESTDLTGFEVATRRQSAVGSGYPPYNTGTPAFNFVFIDACDTNDVNDWAEALLFPHRTSYNTYLENQALVGYTQNVWIEGSRPVNVGLWDDLVDGWDVDHARVSAHFYYPGPKPPDPRDFMHLWGDFYTRIRGVYTGGPGQESRWFR